MTQQELDKIVEQHQHWLKEDCEGCVGMRANLSGANLSKADLIGANLDDEKTWPQIERDGEYVLVYFGTDSLLEHGEYPYEIKRAEAVPNYSGVVGWVRMTEFFKAIEKELGI